MSRREEVADDLIDFLDEATGADYRAMLEALQTAMTKMAMEQQQGNWPHALRDINFIRKAYDRNEDHKHQIRSLDHTTATRH